MRAAWVPAFLLAACAGPAPSLKPPPVPVERPSASATATDDAPARSTSNIPPELRRPPRPGECELEAAFADLLGGQPASRCDEHLQQGDAGDAQQIRACMLGAIKQRKAFTATFRRGAVYDSIVKHAYVGRPTADGYEVREFDYDSCPSGCGEDDPVWWSHVCSPLEDLRTACSSRSRRDKDEYLRHACERAADGQPRSPKTGSPLDFTVWLGAWCNQPHAVDSCPRSRD